MAQATKAHSTQERKWAEMNALQRIAFVGKTCVFFLTAGFVFPTVLGGTESISIPCEGRRAAPFFTGSRRSPDRARA
jgi:hypothetical protein